MRCIDASKLDWYPSHHRLVSLRKEEADAKGSKADTEGSKDTSGFQFKVFTLCYLTSFDEVRCLVGCLVGAETCVIAKALCDAHLRLSHWPLQKSSELAAALLAMTAQPAQSLGIGLSRLSGICQC